MLVGFINIPLTKADTFSEVIEATTPSLIGTINTLKETCSKKAVGEAIPELIGEVVDVDILAVTNVQVNGKPNIKVSAVCRKNPAKPSYE